MSHVADDIVFSTTMKNVANVDGLYYRQLFEMSFDCPYRRELVYAAPGLAVKDFVFDGTLVSVDTSRVEAAATDVPSSIGEFIGTYTEPIDSTEVDITTTTPINLSTMVRFHWNLPDSQLKHRLHKCWATKKMDATWSDSDVVQLAGDGCPTFPWITVSNPGEIRFPVFSFVNSETFFLYCTVHICGRSTDEYCARETACADDDGNNDLLKEIYQIQPGLGRKRKSARSEDNFFVETTYANEFTVCIDDEKAVLVVVKEATIVVSDSLAKSQNYEVIAKYSDKDRFTTLTTTDDNNGSNNYIKSHLFIKLLSLLILL